MGLDKFQKIWKPFFMKYESFKYISPLRAEDAVPPSQLKSFNPDDGWIAQIKKNGTNNLIFVSPDKDLLPYNRHGKRQKTWTFSNESAAPFLNLPGKGWYVINAELMHAKTGITKDTNYIHDILVADGEWLFGQTYEQRYELLADLFLPQADGFVTTSHVCINERTWLARNHMSDFRTLFDSIDDKEDEGIVLKKMNVPYLPKMLTWTYKCRKQHKNYSY